jgi:hypothetical protein
MWYAVRYLRGALDRGQEYPESVRNKLSDYERKEMFQSHWLELTFWDWRRLVEGSGESVARQVPSELEQRRVFIEQEYERVRKRRKVLCQEYMNKSLLTAQSTTVEDLLISEAPFETARANQTERLARDGMTSEQWAESREALPEADRLSKWFGPEPAPSSANTYTIPARDQDGRLTSDSTFTVRTGVLLWGQVMQLYDGSIENTFTTIPPAFRGCAERETLKDKISHTVQQLVMGLGSYGGHIRTMIRVLMPLTIMVRRGDNLAGSFITKTSTPSKQS